MVFSDYFEPYFPSMKSVLIFFFVVYIPMYIVSVTFFRRRIRKTPFALPSLIYKAHKKLITSRRSRDAVLRQHFNTMRVPEKIDVIIVGSSLSGMITAGLLARSGTKVLVLERHSVVGGKLLEQELENDYSYELDQHFGNMRTNSVLRLCMDQVTNGNLDWREIKSNFDEIYVCHGNERKRYSVNKDDFQANLLREFPQEKVAIKRFFELLDDVQRSLWYVIWIKLLPLLIVRFLRKIVIFQSLSRFFSLSKRSLSEVLNELTVNEELKSVLSYHSYNYCESPSSISFVSFAFRFNQVLNEGAFYPVGGLTEIFFNIVPVIESAKGKVLVSAPVVALLSNEKRITGVKVTVDNGTCDIHAKSVIFARGVCEARELMPKKFYNKVDWIESHEPSINQNVNIIMQIWLDTSKDDSNLRCHNAYFLLSENVYFRQRYDDWLKLPYKDASKQLPPCFMVSCPSAKDPEWRIRFGENIELVSVSFIGARKWVPEFRRNWDVRKQFFQTIWEEVTAAYPHLLKIDIKKIDLHINDEPFWEEHISRYSFEKQSILRPDSGMKSILLTGGNIFIDGFIGEIYSAILSASFYVNRNLMSELMQLKRGVEAGKG